MTRTSLAERMSRLEQQKARLASEEAKIKNDERKARTRRLIEAGGLVEKAGLLDLEPNALYGALLSLSAGAKDSARVAEWAKAGGNIFDREAKARDAGKRAADRHFRRRSPDPLHHPIARRGLTLEQGAASLGGPRRPCRRRRPRRGT